MKQIHRKVSDVLTFFQSSKLAFILFTQILLGMIVIILTLLVFFQLGNKVLSQETFFFDSSIINFIYQFRSSFMTIIMKGITFLGGNMFLGTAIVVTILYLAKKHKKNALIFTFIFVLGVGLNTVLKNFFQRPRPELLPLIYEPTYSFPSGHAMGAFIFYTSLSYFVFWKIKNKKLRITLITLSGLLIFLIGISRIYLGVHYPSDVLAGYIAGLCWFVMVLLFEKSLTFRKLYKAAKKLR